MTAELMRAVLELIMNYEFLFFFALYGHFFFLNRAETEKNKYLCAEISYFTDI